MKKQCAIFLSGHKKLINSKKIACKQLVDQVDSLVQNNFTFGSKISKSLLILTFASLTFALLRSGKEGFLFFLCITKRTSALYIPCSASFHLFYQLKQFPDDLTLELSLRKNLKPYFLFPDLEVLTAQSESVQQTNISFLKRSIIRQVKFFLFPMLGYVT